MSKITVMTFNLRNESKVDGINYLDNRKGKIIDTILNYQPDLVGFQEARDNEKARFEAYADDKAYHPGRCAKVFTADGEELGIFGQIHPLTAKNYDIDIPVYAGQLSFDAIWDASDMEIDYKPLPKFPASTRDFSFVCEEELTVGAISEVIAKAAGKLLEDVKLFDIFRGEKLGAGKKSVSFRVTLRASDRTLTVEEADKASAKIIKALDEKLGIALRS